MSQLFPRRRLVIIGVFSKNRFIGFLRNMTSQGETISYLRVSTRDQVLDKNKTAILWLINDKQLGSGHLSFVEETPSGKNRGVSFASRSSWTV